MNGRRDPLAVAAVVLAVVAFAGSFTHVRETVEQHGQAGWLSFAIAAMPELSVLLAVVKVRRDGVRQPWAWIVGGTAAAFTVAANLAQAEPSVWGLVVAGWPAWAALSAAGLIEIGRPMAAEQPVPVAPVLAEPVTDTPVAVVEPMPAPDSAEPPGASVPDVLTGTAAEVAALVEADPDLSVSEIARRVGKSRTTVTRHLQRLAPAT